MSGQIYKERKPGDASLILLLLQMKESGNGLLAL